VQLEASAGCSVITNHDEGPAKIGWLVHYLASAIASALGRKERPKFSNLSTIATLRRVRLDAKNQKPSGSSCLLGYGEVPEGFSPEVIDVDSDGKPHSV